jgi:hypothetical protein
MDKLHGIDVVANEGGHLNSHRPLGHEVAWKRPDFPDANCFDLFGGCPGQYFVTIAKSRSTLETSSTKWLAFIAFDSSQSIGAGLVLAGVIAAGLKLCQFSGDTSKGSCKKEDWEI